MDCSEAIHLQRTGRLAEAAAWYQARLASADDSVAAVLWCNLGTVYHDMGRPEEAAHCYRQALRRDPLDKACLYNLGEACRDLADLDTAEQCYRLALEIDPDYGRGHGGLGALLLQQGRSREAAASLERALELGDEPAANRHLLAAARGEAAAGADPAYLRDLYDGYAVTFESSLAAIGYDAPARLRLLLDETFPDHGLFDHGLDLGCGTGLAGAAFRDACRSLTGVDLSAGMLAQARAKGIYDRLCQEEISSFLAADGGRYDLVLLTDVLIYLGDLVPLWQGLGPRLVPGGLVLFSVETVADTPGYRLRTSGRFAHGPAYVQACCRDHGLTVLARRPVPLRRQGRQWLDGDLYLCRWG